MPGYAACWATDKFYEVALTQYEYNTLKVAKSILIEILEFEEKIVLLLESYQEYEQELFKATMRAMVWGFEDWSALMDTRLTINRRIAGLLTACKMYNDQTSHTFSNIFGSKSEQLNNLNNLKEKERKNSASFKFMEGLRDYVQHQGMPVFRLTNDVRLINIDGEDIREYTFDALLYITKVNASKRKNSTALLAEEPNQYISIKPLIRQYIDAFIRLHLASRSILAEKVASSDNVVQEILDRCSTTAESVVKKIDLMSIEGEEVIETTPISLDWKQRRCRIEQLLSYERNFQGGIVTTRVRKRRS